MDQAPSMEKIEFFLRSVFDYLDRYTQFTDRPMSDERHWVGKDAPVVHLIFMDDVVAQKPVLANYVTLFVTGQVFRVEQYVDACVKVIQSLREEDLPDDVIRYTNNLVNVYARSTKPAYKLPESELATAYDETEERTDILNQGGTKEHPLATAPVKEVQPPVELPVEEKVRTDSDRNHVDLTPLDKQDKESGTLEATILKDRSNGWQ